MIWFQVFLAVMIAQFTATAGDCTDCVSQIQAELKKLHDAKSIEVSLLNTTNAKIKILLSSLILFNGIVCPDSSGNYKLNITFLGVTLETDITTTVSQITNEILNVYSTLATSTKLLCQNGATVRNNTNNILSLPELNTTILNCPDASSPELQSSDEKVEFHFESYFGPFQLKLSLHNITDGEIRISDLEYNNKMNRLPTRVQSFCSFSGWMTKFENMCECIVETIFQKSFFETVIPYVFACHINSLAFQPLRDALKCLR